MFISGWAGYGSACPRAMAFLEEIHSTFLFLCPGNLLGQEFGSASVSHLQFFFRRSTPSAGLNQGSSQCLGT